jgi:hypothetical protein
MEKIIYVICMQSNNNNYSIGNFDTQEEVENYIKTKNLDVYAFPIILKKMA